MPTTTGLLLADFAVKSVVVHVGANRESLLQIKAGSTAWDEVEVWRRTRKNVDRPVSRF